jgi:predicted O-methyltransferase YrrM
MIVTDAVSRYLEAGRTPPDPLLAEMEAHGARDGIPIVVPTTGRLLQILAGAARAGRAVEIGTAIGVSTLYIARGLAPEGRVVSFEIDSRRQDAARTYLERAGVADRVDLRLQDAREGLAELEGEFDFAFMDGVKSEYEAYFELLLPRLARGAVLTVDNVLMGGSVAEDDPSPRATRARDFNERLMSHPELTATVTPIGDGVLIAVKRPADGRDQSR